MHISHGTNHVGEVAISATTSPVYVLLPIEAPAIVRLHAAPQEVTQP